MSPCHHIVRGLNITYDCCVSTMNTVPIMETVPDHGDSAGHGGNADHGDSGYHGDCVDHSDSAYHA